MVSVIKTKIGILWVRTEQVHTNLLSLSLGKARKMTRERSQHKMWTWERGVVSWSVAHGQRLKEPRDQHGPWQAVEASVQMPNLGNGPSLETRHSVMEYISYLSNALLVNHIFLSSYKISYQYKIFSIWCFLSLRKRYNEQRDLIRTKKYTL